jgi:hypothetical protein
LEEQGSFLVIGQMSESLLVGIGKVKESKYWYMKKGD